MPVSKSRKKKPPRRQPEARPVKLDGARRGPVQMCTGRQLDHRDGSMSCTRGAACAGLALWHIGWSDCDVYAPCAHCDGPPVVWIH